MDVLAVIIAFILIIGGIIGVGVLYNSLDDDSVVKKTWWWL